MAESTYLFLVTTGWRGEGLEGVVVSAADEQAACDAAAEALRDHHNARLTGRSSPQGWLAEDVAQHVTDTHERAHWRTERIELPWIGEFA